MKKLLLSLTLCGNIFALQLPNTVYKNAKITPESGYDTFKIMSEAKSLFNDGKVKDASGFFIKALTKSSQSKADKNIEQKILTWCNIKNTLYNGQAGLQFSINSTDTEQRNDMFQNMSLSLVELSEIGKKMPFPMSRKYTLNFAFSSDFIIDAKYIRDLFDPEKFMCKITPIHNNIACSENNISTVGGYDSWQPYQKPEQDLIAVGFDVLVFVPSIDEEDGLVTCGNVVLGGGEVKTHNSIIKIHGLKQ